MNKYKSYKPKERLLEYKIEHIKKEKIDPEILKGKDKRVIELSKRIGNCEVIFKKEQRLLKNKNKEVKENNENDENNKNEDNKKEKEKEKDIEIEIEKENYRTVDNTREKPKELNKSNRYTRFYRQKGRIFNFKNNNYKDKYDKNNNDNDNDNDNNNDNDKNSEEEKIKQENYLNDRRRFREYVMNKPNNNTYNEIVVEKKIIVESDDDKKSNIYNNKTKPFENISKRRQYLNNTNDNVLNNRISTASFEERRFVKRPSYQLNSIPIYTRKKIENKKPDRNEILIEIDNENENESNAPPHNFKKNNIRIRMKNEKLDEDDKYNYNVKNTNLQNYNTNSNFRRNIYFGTNTAHGLFFEDKIFGKYGKQFIPSFDHFIDDDEDDYINERNFLKTQEYKYLHEEFIKEKPYDRKIIEDVKRRNIKNKNYFKILSKSEDYDDY